MITLTQPNKFILLFALISIFCCLLYLPWKAEKKFSYGNKPSYQLGFAFIGYKPYIYTDSDVTDHHFTLSDPFRDIDELDKSNLEQQRGMSFTPIGYAV